MAIVYKRRYDGGRWRLLFGAYTGAEEYAVNELQRLVQLFLPYVICVEPATAGAAAASGDDHLILIGTAARHPLLADLAARGTFRLPAEPQAYSLALIPSPWHPGCRVLVIAGADPAGVLYGVEDLCARVLAPLAAKHGGGRSGAAGAEENPGAETTPATRRAALDGLAEFAISEAPRIADRGIWTWGYVIDDYRRFLDHMARLRLNMLTLWNDTPPLNTPQLVQYAHSRGVKLIFGFNWGWGRDDIDIANPAHRRQIRAEVVREYAENYRNLGLDGIYFQTLTEHHTQAVGDQTLAAVVRDWVNEIAAGLFELEPGLHIQFGLHATSIGPHYADLLGLDPRITIVWEDAGVLPYSYDPVTELPAADPRRETLGTPELTLAYSKKLAACRPGSIFGMVPKGWMALHWDTEFEHHGPFILGERHPELSRRRLGERQARWDTVNRLWFERYPLAIRFYREILDIVPRMLVTGLVEDGLFEETIQPSVALFAETLWDPTRDPADIAAQAALRTPQV